MGRRASSIWRPASSGTNIMNRSAAPLRVLVIDASGKPWPHRDRRARFSDQLLGGLVQTNGRSVWVLNLEDLGTAQARIGQPIRIVEFSAPITFARHDPLMSDAVATPEQRPHTSLFTRLRIVEAELEELKALFADLREDHEALREDRDEWRWRAEYLLAESQKGFLGRLGQRLAEVVTPFARRLNALL
jgi:hypothetical protein